MRIGADVLLLAGNLLVLCRVHLCLMSMSATLLLLAGNLLVLCPVHLWLMSMRASVLLLAGNLLVLCPDHLWLKIVCILVLRSQLQRRRRVMVAVSPLPLAGLWPIFPI